MLRVAQEVGLVDAIDRRLHLLQLHCPYHESDHVLNFAFNALCGGTCLQDIELRRNDECYLDSLGAETIPDPTTAGDFCRRFRGAADVRTLLDAIDDARLDVWQRQPGKFLPRRCSISTARWWSRPASARKGWTSRTVRVYRVLTIMLFAQNEG